MAQATGVKIAGPRPKQEADLAVREKPKSHDVLPVCDTSLSLSVHQPWLLKLHPGHWRLLASGVNSVN